MEDDAYPDDPYTGPEIHTYTPDTHGKCTGGWYNNRGKWIDCNSTQRSSVLHDDPEAAFRAAHWHGGGDCMCFEIVDELGEDEDRLNDEPTSYDPDSNPAYRQSIIDAGRGELLR